jgi:hypothetical protein
MNLKHIAAASMIALATTLTGCYTVTIDARDADRIYSLSGKPGGAVVRSFRVEMKAQHLVYGLITLSTPDVQAAIAREVKSANGKSVANIRITNQMALIDGVIGGVTFGIYTPTTVIIEGDVIR